MRIWFINGETGKCDYWEDDLADSDFNIGMRAMQKYAFLSPFKCISIPEEVTTLDKAFFEHYFRKLKGVDDDEECFDLYK